MSNKPNSMTASTPNLSLEQALEPNVVLPEASAAPQSSLEQVRNILFGEQQRNFSKELAALESRVMTLEKRAEDLELELGLAREELGTQLRNESQRQDKALHNETNRLDKAHTTDSQRLNQLITQEISQLRVEHQQANANAADGSQKERARLAALLVNLAEQLEAD